MVTMTMLRMGAFSTGRITTRSMRMPPAKAMTRVAKNANQYGKPAWSRDQQR
jgi:hypothetical protein